MPKRKVRPWEVKHQKDPEESPVKCHCQFFIASLFICSVGLPGCGDDTEPANDPWSAKATAIDLSYGWGMPGPEDGDECVRSIIHYAPATGLLHAELCDAGFAREPVDVMLDAAQKVTAQTWLSGLVFAQSTYCYEDVSVFSATITEQQDQTRTYSDSSNACNDEEVTLDRDSLLVLWNGLVSLLPPTD